jgi:hypothetical protein
VHSSRQGRRGGEDVHVELAVAPPSSAIAIVLLDEAAKPKSWKLLTDGQTTVPVYTVGGCIALPNGTRPTKPGDLVQVAFVDAAGRMSAVSKPIKVTAKPSPAQP